MLISDWFGSAIQVKLEGDINILRLTPFSFVMVAVMLAGMSPVGAKVVSFADNGGLKMFYDNRMYPQAVALGNEVHIVWRGYEKGYPHLITYDLQNGKFSEPRDLMIGYEDQINQRRYRSDHHYAPVIWSDKNGHLHVLHGCHRTSGIHLISRNPRSADAWVRGPDIADSISYPQVHRIYQDRTLMYSRWSGHLGHWQYHISADGGRTWEQSPRAVIDLNGEPQDGIHASHSGSYNTTVISADGKRLHVAFIWKVEDPLYNKRYGRILHDHTQRYNLYYLAVDLPSGRGYNIAGREVDLPLRKLDADEHCLVWNTDERPASVGPSIALDKRDQPHFLLPVAKQDPFSGAFYFVSFVDGSWRKTPIADALHPFNSSYLELGDDGAFYANMITGSGEAVIAEGMDQYGFGHRVERWISRDGGANWELERDLSPKPGLRYQGIQFISVDMTSKMKETLLFYGWERPNTPGQAFLWRSKRGQTQNVNIAF